MFFDRAAVTDKVKEGTKSPLAKFGAFVRQRAKGLLRKRKKSATPGNPPSSHIGLLKDLIFFGYDTSHSVLVGPTRFRSGTPTAPQLLEQGGRTIRRGKPALYRQFPFMAPALEAEAPKFPELFANSVRG